MIQLQDQVFLTGEGDAWHRRNAEALSARKSDPMLNVIAKLDNLHRVRSVCDLGCANGWRLDRISRIAPNATRFVGVDPSALAIEAGRKAWPKFDLSVGTLSENTLRGAFDLILVNAVFSWVDRKKLADSIAAIDKLVADGGAIIIGDFAAAAPTRTPYHHRNDVAVFTHKQNYADCFLSLGLYRETFRGEWSHGANEDVLSISTQAAPDNERWSVTVLIKTA